MRKTVAWGMKNIYMKIDDYLGMAFDDSNLTKKQWKECSSIFERVSSDGRITRIFNPNLLTLLPALKDVYGLNNYSITSIAFKQSQRWESASLCIRPLRPVCHIKFISKAEMKKYSSQCSNNKEGEVCIALIDEAITYTSKNIGNSNEIIKYSNSLKGKISEFAPEYLIPGHIIREYTASIERIISEKYLSEERLIKEKLNSILDLFKSLIAIGENLGCYHHQSRYIYICLENIAEAANYIKKTKTTKTVNECLYNDMVDSVIIHEYTHCIHKSCVDISESQRIKRNLSEKESCVLETVAESIQRMYIKDIKNNDNLLNWITEHSDNGSFPYWGYAGETILRNFSEKYNKSYEQVLEKVISLSISDYEKAYSFIEWLKMLDQLD